MNTIRWGLVSTANINKRLIPAIRESERGELVAVASRSLEKAQVYAREWEIPLAYGDYQAMFDAGEVDAVYISLPNHLHAEYTIKALNSGLHVLCEKPFANTLEEVDAMIAASREHGLALAEAFMYRHHPQTKKIGQIVRSGKLGEIKQVRGVFNFLLPEKQRQPGNLNVRLIPEFGGGSLWDIGVYPVSLAQYVIGRAPSWVFGSRKMGETRVDESFSGLLGYSGYDQSGPLAQISCSFETPFHTRAEIIGTEGKLEITHPFTNLNRGRKLIFTNKKGRRRKIRISRKSLYLGEVEDMHAVILDGAEPLISLEESRNHIATVLALYRSAHSEQVARL